MLRPSKVAAYHRRVVAWLLSRSRWRRRRPVATLAGGALTWVWPWANPPFWAIYQTHDGGATFVLEETGWDGALREYAPADGNLPAYVVGVDAADREVTGRSDVATPVTVPAPVIIGGTYAWDVSYPGMADVSLTMSFALGVLPVAQLQVWCAVDGGAEYWVGNTPSDSTSYVHSQATEGEATLTYRLRYVDGPTVGPWSAPYPVVIAV